MQNKGFVRVFAILLGLVCLYYLSFSIVTGKYNSEADAYAGGDATKENYYLDSLANKKVWLGYTLKQCRENEITLGLDLKGGMNVILELNVADVIRSLSGNNTDVNFNAALDAAFKRQANSQSNFIDLFVEEYHKLAPGAALSGLFRTFELKDRLNASSTDADVIKVIRAEFQSAIDNSFNVLRTRIDRFGVVSPNIQRLETDGRILVELPGVKEPDRVRKLLQGSANLEFWETHNLAEIYQKIVEADDVLAKMNEAEAAAAVEKPATADETAAATAGETPNSQTEQTNIDPAKTETAAADSLLEQLNADNPEIAQSDADFAKLHPLFALLTPNIYNGQIVPGPVVGVASKHNMDKIDSLLQLRQVKEVLPSDVFFRWAVKSRDENEQFYELYALKVTKRDGSPA
ncbi:MAG: protein translocase subunit SecDF, partial [Tannerella sp.]|nr:protein translocase subunit SecDF [Tannerella sp.]